MGSANRTGSSATLRVMSNLDRRGGYTPRRQREQRAYRLAMVGGTAGVVGVVSLVLAGGGGLRRALPVIPPVGAAVCVDGLPRPPRQRQPPPTPPPRGG